MLQLCAKKIAQWCSDESEDVEIIQYGMELILENIVKMTGIILIALLIGYVKEVMVASIVFMSLRSMAGGVHCKTSLGCFGAMVLVIGISVYLRCITIPGWVYILGTVCVEIIVYLYAPSDTSNNPITDETLRKRKRIGAVVLVGLFFCIFLVSNNIEIKNIVFVSMGLEGITIIPLDKLKKKKGDY